MFPSDLTEQEYQEKAKYCSSLHGDPYPPCYNPKWTCEDCKAKWAKRPIGVTKEVKQEEYHENYL